MSLAKTTTNLDKLIGQMIRVERLAAGMSQTKLGEALGITFQQVQKYEKGTNRVATGTFIMIAKTLGVTPVSMFSHVVGKAIEAGDI